MFWVSGILIFTKRTMAGERSAWKISRIGYESDPKLDPPGWPA